MIRLDLTVRINEKQRLAYIPKALFNILGTHVTVTPNRAAVLMFSEKTPITDVIKSLDIIKTAIEKIESNKPLKDWSPKKVQDTIKKLEENDTKGLIHVKSRRTLHSHLKQLTKKGDIINPTKGEYHSKQSEFWREILHYSLKNQLLFESKPYMNPSTYKNHFDQRMKNIRTLKEIYEKSLRKRIFNRKILQKLKQKESQIEPFIRNEIDDTLKIIYETTTISVFSAKQNEYLDILLEGIQNEVADFLFELITLERQQLFKEKIIPEDETELLLASDKTKKTLGREYWLESREKVSKDSKLLQSMGLNIHINFNPKNSKVRTQKSESIDIHSHDKDRVSTFGCKLSNKLIPRLKIFPIKEKNSWQVIIKCSYPKNLESRSKRYIGKEIRKLGCERCCKYLLSQDDVVEIIKRIDLIGNNPDRIKINTLQFLSDF